MLYIIDGDWIDKRMKTLSEEQDKKEEELRAIEYSENQEDFDTIEDLEKELAGIEAALDELNNIKQQLKPLVETKSEE